MKWLIRGIRYVAMAFFVVVIACNGILLVKRLAFKEELPSLFGCSAVTVMSGSMEPEFSPGDMLIIKGQEQYQTGDIVTYNSGGSFITHRIVGKDGDAWVTQGDANNAPDGTLLRDEDLYGKVCLVIPKLGNAAIFLRTPFGTLLLCVGLFALVELSIWMGGRKEET